MANPTPMALSLSRAEIAFILTVQFAVPWAGEGGEEPRLAWWRSDFISELPYSLGDREAGSVSFRRMHAGCSRGGL